MFTNKFNEYFTNTEREIVFNITENNPLGFKIDLKFTARIHSTFLHLVHDMGVINKIHDNSGSKWHDNICKKIVKLFSNSLKD